MITRLRTTLIEKVPSESVLLITLCTCVFNDGIYTCDLWMTPWYELGCFFYFWSPFFHYLMTGNAHFWSSVIEICIDLMRYVQLSVFVPETIDALYILKDGTSSISMIAYYPGVLLKNLERYCLHLNIF